MARYGSEMDIGGRKHAEAGGRNPGTRGGSGHLNKRRQCDQVPASPKAHSVIPARRRSRVYRSASMMRRSATADLRSSEPGIQMHDRTRGWIPGSRAAHALRNDGVKFSGFGYPSILEKSATARVASRI